MSKQVIGYFSDWQYYDREQLVSPWNLPNSWYQKYTIINYAFFDYLELTRDGSLRGIDNNSHPQLLHGQFNWDPQPNDTKKKYLAQDGTWKSEYFKGNGLIGRCHDNGIKVMASIGGWSYSPGMPQLFDIAANRQKFADFCGLLIKEYGFDGIDIDWEYPGKAWTDNTIFNAQHGYSHTPTPRDASNFTDLIQKIRTVLNSVETEVGKQLIITSCFNANPAGCAYDINGLVPNIDYFNLMTYDLAGAFSTKTNHQSSLYMPSWYTGTPGEEVYSCDTAVNDYIALGVPASKINIGLASYGRTLKGATTMNSTFDGTGNPSLGNDGMPLYYEILAQQSGWTYHWDDTAKAGWWNTGDTVITGDNPASATEKGKYIVSKGIAGIIEWEITGGILTDYSTPIIDALRNGLTSNITYKTITVNQPSNGIISPASVQVEQGGNKTFTIKANDGYVIDNVLIDGNPVGSNETYTFTNVQENHVITASFNVDTTPRYSITKDGSNVVFTGPDSVIKNGSATINFAAKTGYQITEVKANNIIVSNNGSYTFTNVTSNQIITVTAIAVTNQYPEWSPTNTYIEGNKVTYSGNVYEAKYWTQNNKPTESGQWGPWKLIGTAGPDSVAPVILISGGNVAINVGGTYVEPGYSATDNVDGNITSKVVTTNNINNAIEGTYSVTYSVSDNAGNTSVVTRSVNVQSVSNDTTSPIITLIGGNITMNVGGTYVEPGYSATDNIDGNITSKVVITGIIDTSTIGTYTRTYTVTDNAGNTASTTRTITIQGQNTGICVNIKVWNSNDSWTSYTIGDKRVNAGKLYECKNTAYSYYEPSGVYGSFGWTLLGTC